MRYQPTNESNNASVPYARRFGQGKYGYYPQSSEQREQGERDNQARNGQQAHGECKNGYEKDDEKGYENCERAPSDNNGGREQRNGYEQSNPYEQRNAYGIGNACERGHSGNEGGNNRYEQRMHNAHERGYAQKYTREQNKYGRYNKYNKYEGARDRYGYGYTHGHSSKYNRGGSNLHGRYVPHSPSKLQSSSLTSSQSQPFAQSQVSIGQTRGTHRSDDSNAGQSQQAYVRGERLQHQHQRPYQRYHQHQRQYQQVQNLSHLPHFATHESSESSLQTILDYIRWGMSQMRAANVYFGHGTDNAWDESVYLVLHTLHLPHNVDRSVLNARLTAEECQEVTDVIQRRVDERLPAPYLTHVAYFAGLEFYVDERVLIPRSPLAELIGQRFAPWIDATTHECDGGNIAEEGTGVKVGVKAREKAGTEAGARADGIVADDATTGGVTVGRILDVGTGSGCIALACAYAFPEAHVDAVDIAQDALAVARINVAKHRDVAERVRLIQSDIFTALTPTDDYKYDVIVSNPPYVNHVDMQSLPQEYEHEPRHALAAGEDGLKYVDVLLKEAKNHLNPRGILIVEVGNSADALMEKYPQMPFVWLEFEHGMSEVFLLRAEDL